MLRAVRLVVVFKGDTDKAAFPNTLKTQSAVPQQLLVLGEAVKRLSAGLRTGYPAIPWSMLAGTRDKDMALQHMLLGRPTLMTSASISAGLSHGRCESLSY